jgi:hypothetical protein
MNMIGKITKSDWSKAPEFSTHYCTKNRNWYMWLNGGSLYHNFLGDWVVSKRPINYFKGFLISKEEDLQMSKETTKRVKSVEDLPQGALVITKDESRGFVKDGRIVWMNSSNSPFHYYKGFKHTGNGGLTIVSYSLGHTFSYLSEFIAVSKESETDIKIRELENTINQASAQIQLLKELQK